MNEFGLQPLPDLMVNVLSKCDQQSLKEFIDKVDLYLIVEESTAGDLFPDSVFDFALKLMDCEIFLASEGSSKLLMVFELIGFVYLNNRRRNCCPLLVNHMRVLGIQCHVSSLQNCSESITAMKM